MVGHVGHIALLAQKGHKDDEGHYLAPVVFGVEIPLVHGVVQPHGTHGEAEQVALLLAQPLPGHLVQLLLQGRVPGGQRPVLRHRHPGLFGVVDVHAHLGALFAADLIVGQMEPGLLPAFHCAEALAAVLLNEVVGQPQKNHPVGGGAAEVGEFCQQGRKIPVGAHRVAVYHHRVPHGAIGHHPVHRSAEIQAFVVLQSQIRAWVLAVQISLPCITRR